MKSKEKSTARKLRELGWSINEIYTKLGVSKSSVSIWVRDIELTKKQKATLSTKGHTKEAIEKRRKTRLTRENARRQKIIDSAKIDIKQISKKELFLIGISLYWGEGSKTRRGIVEFSNSDPLLIEIMMKFFKENCEVPPKKFRGHVYLHTHLDPIKAEKYWSKISRISTKQFFKTSQQHNKASKNKKDSLPYGTFSIYVCNTKLFLKIKGWMESMYNVIINK
ncbi:hypothetical protein KKF64_01070 [Patescibacteria group bacterium]|nr:hypothetical protein [Patescibacteria group bacterium]